MAVNTAPDAPDASDASATPATPASPSAPSAPSAPATLHARRPAVRHFVRLKLRVLGNGMRGSGARVALFLVGLLVGLSFAGYGFAAFAVGSVDDDPRVRLAVIGLAGSGLTLAWVLVPLLFFGVDETLDPARFALLPLPRRTLTFGLVAAACVGIPAVATFLATLGLAVGGGLRAGPAGFAVAGLGAVVGLLVCVLASRAVTSAFATMLRSRRVRDLALIIMVLLASMVWPVQMIVMSTTRDGTFDLGTAAAIARVLAWTPLDAPYAAALDAIDGRWALVPVRLAIGLVTIGLLAWWWSRTLESAMVGSTSAGPSERRGGGRERDGAVASLFPAALRRLPANRFRAMLTNRFGAMVARECRYWWRDPRRRANLASVTITSVIVPVFLALPIPRGFGPGTHTMRLLPLPIALAFAGFIATTALANQFGADGTAYGGHLLAGVPGRLELLARAATLGLIVLPLLLAATVVLGLATGMAPAIPAATGSVVAGFGVSLGVTSLVSVLAPFPMPDTSNPFAVGSGGASLKGMLSLVGSVASMALTTPVVVAYLLLQAVGAGWVTLPLGLAWGLAGAWLGAYIAGDRLDRRAPEVLVAVTPRR